MALVDRARAMIVSPAREWPAVAIEPTAIRTLFTSYIIPLAAISSIFGFVGSFILTTVFLHSGASGASDASGAIGVSISVSLVGAIIQFAFAILGVTIIALVAEALAPSFDGTKDRAQAFKWIGYAYTATWVAGFALLVPVVGSIVGLVGGLYSLYVLYLGAQPMMNVPQTKALGYTVVVVIVALVINLTAVSVTFAIVGALTAGAVIGSGALHH